MRTYEALIDPIWKTSIMALGGARFVWIRLKHPRHGDIDWIMPAATADRLAASLSRVAEIITGPKESVGGVGS